MELHQLNELLDKYLRNTCTQEEKKLIEGWLDNHYTIDASDDEEAVNEKVLQVKTLIDRSIGGRQRLVIPLRRWIAVAAVLLLVTLGTFKLLRPVNTRSMALKPATATPVAPFTSKTVNGWTEVSTTKGVTHTITLTDGSVVVLNAMSRLRYPAQFSGHKRPVYLDEGEAFFTVAKDKTSPFTVYTHQFATTALGTAFNIRAYNVEYKVCISLIHGKIKVDDLRPDKQQEAAHVLIPHQQLVLDKTSSQLKGVAFNDEQPVTGWKDGILSFDNASREEVINKIENKFGIEIIYNSSKTTWSYTGSFKQDSLDEVLQTISLTEGISYSLSKDKKQVIFY